MFENDVDDLTIEDVVVAVIVVEDTIVVVVIFGDAREISEGAGETILEGAFEVSEVEPPTLLLLSLFPTLLIIPSPGAAELGSCFVR